jgi:acetoin:2,6-dichlorophenolindophenol oxidoreductase subunit beta
MSADPSSTPVPGPAPTSGSTPVSDVASTHGSTPDEVSYIEAINAALKDAMRDDETIILLGQDISAGFPFGATRGLAELFGKQRVRDTPISEAATMGCGIGAAMMGTRTVVEVDFAGFLLLGLDQLVNNAAKLRYMSGGQLRVPLVVRVGQGPFGSFAAQHSQSQHGWLASVPGLALCVPSTPQDAYDMLRWALRAGDPVVFAEDMRLYRHRGRLRDATQRSAEHVAGSAPSASASALDAREGVPRAHVARTGRDATAVCYGFGTTIALRAAAELSARGIELEVLDLRLLSPLDEAAIGESARHTGRVLCVGDDPLLGGITGTLAAAVEERAHGRLSAPVARLGARHMPTPFGSGEAYVYPSAESIARAVRRLVAWPAQAQAEDLEIENGELRMAPG